MCTWYDGRMKFRDRFPSLDRRPEEVKGAVIRYQDENFEGSNHQMAMDKITARFPDYQIGTEEARGWLTTKGRIVSDEEAQALELARKNATGEDTEIMRDPESTLFKPKNE